MGAFVDEAYLREALAGRRVLVTGHTGFKGGWLSLWLRRLGATVVGVALPPQEHSFCAAVGLEELVDSRMGDIRSQASFGASVEGQDYDLVIHMAAQAVVRASYQDPVDTYLTNIIGTAIVLEAARKMPSLRGIIVVTSDKCYENHEWVWGYRELDPMGGRDPYSSSKGCAELIAAAYRASFFNNPDGPQLATVRAGNVVGGGDWGADRLVPDLVRAAETRSPARIRNPRNIRPWQHVLEPVRGYLMLAARLIDTGKGFAGSWNFGCDRDAAVDVITLADLVVERWKENAPHYVVEQRGKEPPESVVLRLDSTKSYVELGWKPLLTISQAVSKTVEWHLRYQHDPGAILRFSEQQIAEYAAEWSVSSEKALMAEAPIGIAACV
jgi:CDP-glucose 4,6-dehydratase